MAIMEGEKLGWSICILFSVDQTHANIYMNEITTSSNNNDLTYKFKLLRIM